MRPIPGTALLTACALALTACNDEPPPPPAPGADTRAPTVTATSPAERAEAVLPGATTEVSITFSEPMKPDTGTLVPSSGLKLGAPTWTGNTLKVPVTGLGHDDAHSLELKGFQDVAGNALDGTALLGDGKLDFHTGSDRPRAAVASASVAEGAQGVYPVEMYYDAEASRPGAYFRKVLSVTFTEAMEPAFNQVTLVNRTDTTLAPRPLTGQWSPDGLTLTLTLTAPEEGGPPLEEESTYALDLSALRSAAAGNRLEASTFLGDGKLDFTTGKRNGDLEHACAHSLVSTAESLAAAAKMPPFGFPPPTDVGHTRYRLTLPEADAGSHVGYTELVSKPDQDERIVLFLNQDVPVGVWDELDAVDVPVEVSPTAAVCPGITHQARFTVTQGDRFYYLRFGATSSAALEFILERYAK
ncbi:MAG TPA: Ig-like domain-containing protein [Archangium sp.]|uniref:Ig-like domain-containing protein n=1 Tax=Archangium sp. TaxID=1872627 RepID=UPI002E376360|nr:Ig-like domain-containing protein [Archangium sp.]HEX5749670.1 Ig-like domain-containing protein [Archangium sp.]